jgi:hypothetical protein
MHDPSQAAPELRPLVSDIGGHEQDATIAVLNIRRIRHQIMLQEYPNTLSYNLPPSGSEVAWVLGVIMLSGYAWGSAS